jgi:myo-inositol-1(or 4)-monophosphatase
MEFWTSVLNFADAITAQVGKQLLINFGQTQAIEKMDGSLVTESDQWADQMLRQAIVSAFPDHGMLSEEAEHVFPDREWCWIIDPLDGTTNFARGLPIWAISLGLLYKGTPIFGYVHLPPLHQSFYGYWAGDSGLNLTNGAFLNGQPIHASPDRLTSNHFFNLCSRSVSALKQPFPCKIRMLGVATYNLLTVASGATLGGVEATPKIWDIAAVWAIVQAAGAVWIPLQSAPIFPLEVGKNYRDRSFPTLVVSQADFVRVFQPLVQGSGKP